MLDANGGTSHLWEVQLVGTFTVWVAARDALGNYSTPVQITGTVAGASVSGLQAAVNGADLVLDYVGVPAAFPIAAYEILSWRDGSQSRQPSATNSAG